MEVVSRKHGNPKFSFSVCSCSSHAQSTDTRSAATALKMRRYSRCAPVLYSARVGKRSEMRRQ